jgi:hypothetical protein
MEIRGNRNIRWMMNGSGDYCGKEIEAGMGMGMRN